jgi:hypothetical protein
MISDKKLAITRIIKQTKNDPVKFVQSMFGIEPTFQQKEVMDSVAKHKNTAVKAGHGVGKSALASWLIYWYLFTRPLARIPVTAPTMHQLKDILWAELGKWRFKSPLISSLTEFTDTRVCMKGSSYKKTWFAVPISARKSENLQGFHADHLFFIADEASGIPNENFEVIEGALTGKGNKMLIQGNPTQPDGYFYDAFNKNADLFNCITLSSMDSPIVEKDYAERIAKKYGKDSSVYRYRVLGLFPLVGTGNTVIPAHWIENSFDTPGSLGEGKRRIAVDVARYGDDETVIVIRKGYTVEAVYRLSSMDEVQIANEIIRMSYIYTPNEIAIETAGVGNGVFDIVKHKRLRAKMLQFVPQLLPNDKATYENAITEAWFNLRFLFQPTANRQCVLSMTRDDDVLEQLTSRRYEVRPDGRIKLEDKAKHKKRNDGASPDIGDALAIAFYEGRFRAASAATIERKIITGSESEWEKIRGI